MLPNVLIIGPVSFHLYGLVLGLGIVTAVMVLEKIVIKEGVESKYVWQGLMIAVVFGVAGARLYHVIDYWAYYSKHLTEVFMVWGGGLGIYGAVVGGGLGLWWYTKKQDLSLVKAMDAAAIVMPLGQAIGRWGNYINQELYGLPTNMPWGIWISLEKRLPGFESNSYFQPLFLYESIGSLFLFGILYTLWRKRVINLGQGIFLALYMIGYGMLRFGLEFMRIGPWKVGGVNVAQMMSIGFIIVGLLIIWQRKRDAGNTNNS